MPLLLVGALVTLGGTSMNIYLPALPHVAEDLGTSASAVQVTVAAFLVGLGAGQPVAGPLSDAFGRRRPMLVAIVVYLVATLGCAMAPNLGVLATGLLQGLAAATGIVIGRAIVRDLHSAHAAARYLSQLVLITGVVVAASLVRDRGLFGVQAVISDAHAGLKAAIARVPGRRRSGSAAPFTSYATVSAKHARSSTGCSAR